MIIIISAIAAYVISVRHYTAGHLWIDRSITKLDSFNKRKNWGNNEQNNKNGDDHNNIGTYNTILKYVMCVYVCGSRNKEEIFTFVN